MVDTAKNGRPTVTNIRVSSQAEGLLWVGGPAVSEDKPPVKNDKQFKGAVGKIREAAGSVPTERDARKSRYDEGIAESHGS